jgi:proteic killer suppression protein
VYLTKNAAKDLKVVPGHIAKKLRFWIALVEQRGLEEVRKIPGFHDETLKGVRAGQRSIRLNQAYRALYQIKVDGSVEFVSIEEVHKHDY